MTATPRPWRVAHNGDGRCIIADDGRSIHDVAYVCGWLDQPMAGRANAALICRAVNAHDELVALVERFSIADRPDKTMREEARALLARIKADSADARPCEGGCGRQTACTVRMLRAQDAGTADALGWAELSVAPMRVAVYLCPQCQADDVVPEGYAEEPD